MTICFIVILNNSFWIVIDIYCYRYFIEVCLFTVWTLFAPCPLRRYWPRSAQKIYVYRLRWQDYSKLVDVMHRPNYVHVYYIYVLYTYIGIYSPGRQEAKMSVSCNYVVWLDCVLLQDCTANQKRNARLLLLPLIYALVVDLGRRGIAPSFLKSR